MNRKLVSRVKYSLLAGINFIILLFQPGYVFAAEEEAESVDWTMGFGLLFVFVLLASVLVMRPSKRRDTVMTDDEIMAEREAQLKKELGRDT